MIGFRRKCSADYRFNLELAARLSESYRKLLECSNYTSSHHIIVVFNIYFAMYFNKALSELETVLNIYPQFTVCLLFAAWRVIFLVSIY